MTHKDLSVLRAYAFESAGFLQSMVFAMQHSLKVVGSDLKLCRFCHATYFQSKMFDKLVPGCIWMCAPYFERVLHGKIRTKCRCEHCSFKVWVNWCCHMEISVFTCICLHLQKLFAKMQISTHQAEINTLNESSTFKDKCVVHSWELYMRFIDWPLNKYDF